MQAAESKIAFICFHSFLRIKTFQSVTGEKIKNSPLLQLARRVVDQRFKQPQLLVFPPLPEEIPLVGMYSDNFRFCQAGEVQDGGGHDRGLSERHGGPFRRRSVLWSGRLTHGGNGRAWRSTAAPHGAALLTASKRARSALSPRAFPRDDASSISPVLGELPMPGLVRIEHAPGSVLLGSIEK
jgi:hypothetical protein